MYQALLARLARTLDSAGVPYMVIGGQAVLLHGEPRLTRDIDITLGVDAGHLPQILALSDSIGLMPAVKEVAHFVSRTNVLPLSDGTTSIRVDLIFSFTPYESEAIRRATTVQIEGTGVSFATAEDLVIHKLVAGRPRDIEDIKGILSRNENLEEEYLQRWIPTFHDIVHRDLWSQFLKLKSGNDS